MRRGQLWRVAANAATLANALCGLGAIAYILAGNKLFGLFLIFSGLGFDGLDGAFSRRSGIPSPVFGRVADSVADAITFCLAPGTALAADNYPSSAWGPVATEALLVGALVAAVGLARLLYYTARGYRHANFVGASTPQNAMAVLLLLLLFQLPGFLGDAPSIVLVGAAVLAPIMVLPVPYPKMRRGAPLRAVVGAQAALIALALVLVNFRPGVGTLPYKLAFAGSVTAFVLLLAFYVLGPVLVGPSPSSRSSGGEDEEGSPEASGAGERTGEEGERDGGEGPGVAERARPSSSLSAAEGDPPEGAEHGEPEEVASAEG